MPSGHLFLPSFSWRIPLSSPSLASVFEQRFFYSGVGHWLRIFLLSPMRVFLILSGILFQFRFLLSCVLAFLLPCLLLLDAVHRSLFFPPKLPPPSLSHLSPPCRCFSSLAPPLSCLSSQRRSLSLPLLLLNSSLFF